MALDWMKRGAAAYLRKPFKPEYLIELCERARRERALLRVQDAARVPPRSPVSMNSDVFTRHSLTAQAAGV